MNEFIEIQYTAPDGTKIEICPKRAAEMEKRISKLEVSINAIRTREIIAWCVVLSIAILRLIKMF